jgi:hypothetical protein
METRRHELGGASAASPSAWQCRAVRGVVPATAAELMFRRARAWSVPAGGRFTALADRIMLWGQGEPRRLVAAIHVRWIPDQDQAEIYAVSWNPAAGGSVDEVCTALELLAGVAR